jgi:glycosyltransferase involved in cell wall biosynthesis
LTQTTSKYNAPLLLDTCIKLIQEGFADIKVYFYGIEAILSEKERVSSLVKHYPLNFFIIPKIPKNRLLMELQNIDVLFLTGYDKIKGWYPVKLFEYYSYGKPILLCPSDQDVMEDFINETNSGFAANSAEECTDIIKKMIIDKRSDNQLFLNRNDKAGEKYSRKHQTKKLAEILQKLK